MVPYLKGLHLTLDSWRSGRDEGGWKLGKVEYGEELDDSQMAELVPGQGAQEYANNPGTRPDLSPAEVDVFEDFGLSRSLRRGSATTAGRHGVSSATVELINRWRKIENAEGMKPALGMREHYSDVRQMLSKLLIYSRSL
jgi:hypothetical protein